MTSQIVNQTYMKQIDVGKENKQKQISGNIQQNMF